MKRILKKAAAGVLALVLLLTSTVFIATAEYSSSVGEAIAEKSDSTYTDYLLRNNLEYYSGEKIVLDNKTALFSDESEAEIREYSGQSETVYWENGKGSVNYTVNIPKTALYNLLFSFKSVNADTSVTVDVEIDGKLPFDGLENLLLSSDYINSGDGIRTDNEGNEISPEQVQTDGFSLRYAADKTGVSIEPYKIAFTEGTHTIKLSGDGYTLAIAELALTAPEQTVSYAELMGNYDFSKSKADSIIQIHAEQADVKSDNTLIPMSTNGDAGMYPIDAYLTKLNYIGGTNWNTPGQKLTWNFTVGKSGYYKFAARYKQNEIVNGDTFRWLKIDGKTPFSEAHELSFGFGAGWQKYVMSVGEEECYIWLNEGEHNISLEVTLGEMTDIYNRLNNAVSTLGDLYLQVVMITGEVPDTNRDYELFRQIPNFNETLENAKGELEALVEDMKKLTDKRGSQYTAAIDNMNRVIGKMLDAPYLAHIYVKDFYTNYTSLCSNLNEIKKMPLAIDEIQLVPYGKEADYSKPSFFEKVWFSVKRFVLSFVDSYSSFDDEERTIKLWVNWGRDQTSALDSLIRDSFTVETGIKVELQIVSNSLINGLLSGDYPDLQLHLSRVDPVNYGMRNALTDLTQFPDYEEVLTRFMPGADTPYWYEDSLYALPDQQTFFLMFYRTDIFEQLGLSVPTTWDEFLDCATVIQRYNMSVYVPYTQIATTTTVNAGIGNLNLYPTLMLQSELSLYNEEKNATVIDSAEGIKVFTGWTEMYSDYGYLKEADFYNRFRNGSMPLGIAPYTTYMTLYSAAPEIFGRWDIANVPGTEGGNAFVAGGGSGCGIVKASDKQEEAWEFLKWWTRADIQLRYNNNVESILGMLGRIPTATVEAFESFSWNPEDKAKILSQWNNVREYPEVPGGYYLTRAVDQAFWSVINDSSNPKDSITKWSKVADDEIERKIKEYSKGE